MSEEAYSLYELVNQDPRYPVPAYEFVLEALNYASDALELSSDTDEEMTTDRRRRARRERHLTGQQFCEAVRMYSVQQFGYMAHTVLKSWNITSTSCIGDLVYNLIKVGIMKKSSRDRRSHFNDVFEFENAFEREFQISPNVVSRRTV